MAKRIDIVYEMVFFLKKMKESDKSAFAHYLKNKRNSILLISMLKAFELCQPLNEAKGLIKRLITIPGGSDYRLFLKFKAHLFEFELSTKRLNYYKHFDSHEYLHMELKKGFLAAQLMSEQDAYINSIQCMKDNFIKAGEFEFIQIQKDCAENLTHFYLKTGEIKQTDHWNKISEKLNENLMRYNAVHTSFEEKLNKIHCCSYHHFQTGTSQTEVKKLKTIKSEWMVNLLELYELRHLSVNAVYFNKSIELYKVVKINPGLFPLHFRLVSLKFVFEDLFRLKKFGFLTGFAKKLYLLEKFPVYKRLPLIKFFLYFLLKTQNYRILELVFEDIQKEPAYRLFSSFMLHFQKIQALYLISKGKSQEVLRKLNRLERIDHSCVFHEFDNRMTELIALYSASQPEVAIDKLENVIKFVQRNPELRNSPYCKSMLNYFKILFMYAHENKSIPVANECNDVYDLQSIFITITRPRAIRIYDMPENLLSIAADEAVSFGKNNKGNVDQVLT